MNQIDVTCRCGITCTRVDIDGRIQWYCARCQQMFEDEPLLEVACDKTTNSAQDIEEGIIRANIKIHKSLLPDAFVCEICGTSMPNACRARCPNCNWERPCS